MRRLIITGVLVAVVGTSAVGAESPQQWFREGKAAVNTAKLLSPINHKAKNVILFIGDGMGVSTVTASRILEGQQRGMSGEENRLSFETFPYTALIKTYETNLQTPDSAGTMTAMMTGVKTQAGVLSVSQNAKHGDYASAEDTRLTTILELAERAGLSTGVISTTRVTHATPAACYAHSPHRDWENDALLSSEARKAGFPDIARQLVEFSIGDGLEVALGGGRLHFLPSSAADPEDSGRTGGRSDGRDLTAEWLKKPNAAYVWNKKQFDAVDASKTDHLLGLFDVSHMEFEHDRAGDSGGEPSLSAMTAKAIDVLARNEKGFFLMVEGGRIDHAHHFGNAYRALTDTIELARAVSIATQKTSREETLIVVTADHSHVFTMAGYPRRGNPILGKVNSVSKPQNLDQDFTFDALDLPYTTLGYANGPGYTGAAAGQPEGPKQFLNRGTGYRGITKGRPDLSDVDTEDPDYLQESTVPMAQDTHGGEDVPLYADGPMAHLFHGVLEQNVIFHVMGEALGLAE